VRGFLILSIALFLDFGGGDMKNNSSKFISQSIILFMCIIITGVSFSCSSIFDSNGENIGTFTGKVVSNFGTFGVLRPDGKIWTWGWNAAGTLGDGTTNNRDCPACVSVIKDAVAFDIREGLAVAADKNGDIWLWGSWIPSSIADRSLVKKPVKIARLSGIVSLDIVHLNVHLVRNDGAVWLIEIDDCKPGEPAEPVILEGLPDIRKVSDYLGLSRDGTLHKLAEWERPHGDLIDGIDNVVDFSSVSSRRTVIVKADGTVWAWGKNSSGSLGNGTYEDSDIPVQVCNLTNVAAVSAHYSWNLALKKDGSVWFWGFVKKQDNTLIGENVPVKIGNLENAAAVYADGSSVVMKKDGSVWLFDVENRIPEKIAFTGSGP